MSNTPPGADTAIRERVDRVARNLARAHKYMNPCLREWAVAGFERHFDVQLPSAYRQFLLRVGNGGWGPPTGGLFSLGEPPDELGELRRLWAELPWVRTPFPFTDRTEQRDWRQTDFGCICLGYEGCGMTWQLVVTGPEAGNVWFDDPNSQVIAPAGPPRDFLGWYETWLEEQDWFSDDPEVAELPPGTQTKKHRDMDGIPF